MFTVALTGGIASGKSIVACYLSKLGVTSIDADQIARELIDNTPEILNQIVSRFGGSILKKNQQLDRIKLRDIIFADPKHRYWLEQLLHPLIYREIQCCIKKALGLYCVVVLPLLLEGSTSTLLKKKPSLGNYIILDRILWVATSKKLQIQRAQERDHLEKNLLDKILVAQVSPSLGMKQADDILYNESSLSSLYASTNVLHAKYLSFLRPQNNLLEESPFLGYYLSFK